jgi:hypothetical protein
MSRSFTRRPVGSNVLVTSKILAHVRTRVDGLAFPSHIDDLSARDSPPPLLLPLRLAWGAATTCPSPCIDEHCSRCTLKDGVSPPVGALSLLLYDTVQLSPDPRTQWCPTRPLVSLRLRPWRQHTDGAYIYIESFTCMPLQNMVVTYKLLKSSSAPRCH